ncbi:hypothetical protein [Streptomyces sp. WG7]|uniref:hypothetical protein n=1 Tax=Streptomyces sp. WG7 TaxID=3417650 RepID=UPI003CF2C3E6
MLLDQLAEAGLPTDGVWVELPEREQALASFGGALRRLSMEDRGRSVYVSKMITAAAAGLFDAALNYLWNETVAELRRRVAGYDPAHFFDIAVPSYGRRKHLSTEDDLVKVDDIDLLRPRARSDCSPPPAMLKRQAHFRARPALRGTR